MSPSELDEYFITPPVRPVRLTLASGDQLVVRPEDRPFVSGLTLIVRGGAEDQRRIPGSFLVSIPNIVLAEPLDGRTATDRRRR